MKKYFILLVVVVTTFTLSSCNWDPTGHGSGGGGNGSGSKDTMDVDREQKIVRVLSNANEIKVNDKFIKVVSVSSLYTNEHGAINVVELLVSNDGGITHNSISLTSVNPIYKDKNCRIELLGVEISPRMTDNDYIYIITLVVN